MAVGHILYIAGKKLGLDPKNQGERSVLVRYLEEAAIELYDQSNMIGILMEQVFKVNGDQTLSMPYYVGPIMAAREYASLQQWHINKMRPRYNQFNWPDMWRNLRIRNTQALQYSVVNASVGVVSVPFVESPPIVVTLVGTTVNAANTIEKLTMSSTSVQSVNCFVDYVTVSKNRINNCDVTLASVDGEPLTVIPNCMYEALYQIIDVSQCPWLPQNTSVLDNYLEILYKKALPVLWNDDDTFPSKTNYDHILVNKIMQLSKEEQDKPELATAYDTKATRSLARKQMDENRAAEDCVALVANPHDTMLKRIGTGLRRRYSLYAGRKY